MAADNIGGTHAEQQMAALRHHEADTENDQFEDQESTIRVLSAELVRLKKDASMPWFMKVHKESAMLCAQMAFGFVVLGGLLYALDADKTSMAAVLSGLVGIVVRTFFPSSRS